MSYLDLIRTRFFEDSIDHWDDMTAYEIGLETLERAIVIEKNEAKKARMERFFAEARAEQKVHPDWQAFNLTKLRTQMRSRDCEDFYWYRFDEAKYIIADPIEDWAFIKRVDDHRIEYEWLRESSVYAKEGEVLLSAMLFQTEADCTAARLLK